MSPAAIDKPEPLYPGAPIMLTRIARGGEEGDVRVQEYHSESFLVCQFIPGRVSCVLGVEPKIVPEVRQWTTTFDEACEVFDRYLTTVRAAGWTEIEDDKEGA